MLHGLLLGIKMGYKSKTGHSLRMVIKTRVKVLSISFSIVVI